MYLNAEKSHYTNIDCKRKFKDPRIGNLDNYSFQCPIISGGVESRTYDASHGFAQEYGRFEVRAKLNNGPGAWPAHWLLPMEGTDDGCGWAHSGEIDIMEHWTTSDHRVSGMLHTGHYDKDIKLSKGFRWKAKSSFYPNLSNTQRAETFFKEFHVFAA